MALGRRAARRDGANKKAVSMTGQGNLALPKLTNQAQVEAAQTARCIGQAEIEIDRPFGDKFQDRWARGFPSGGFLVGGGFQLAFPDAVGGAFDQGDVGMMSQAIQ